MELKASQDFLTEALTNGTFSMADTESALQRSLTNSFSYLYRLQKNVMDYEEFYFTTRNVVKNPDYGDMWLDKKDRICINFKVSLIAPQNRERYKRSDYFRKEIPLFDTVNTTDSTKFEYAKEKTLFNKLPVLHMDGSIVKNFSVIIYDNYFTMILPFKKSFLFKEVNGRYPWDSSIVNTYDKRYNGTTGNNLIADHEFKLQIISNNLIFDINTTRPNLTVKDYKLTLTESYYRNFTTEEIPTDGCFFATISLSSKGNGTLTEDELYKASTLQDVDIVENEDGTKSLVINLDSEMYSFINSTTRAINIHFIFFKYLKKFYGYRGDDVYVRKFDSKPFSELFIIQKEEAETWELPIPIENLMILKIKNTEINESTGHSTWNLFDHSNVKINYPNIYHVEDNVEVGDRFRVYYFYREAYDLRYEYMYRFYMRYLYFKWGQPKNMTVENIINKLYFGDVNLDTELDIDYTDLEQLAVTKQAQLLINDGVLQEGYLGSYSNFILGLTRQTQSTTIENALDLYLENADLTVYEPLPLVVSTFWECFNIVVKHEITEYKFDDVDYLKNIYDTTGKEFQLSMSPFEYKVHKLKSFIKDDIKCLHEYILQNNKTSIKYNFDVDTEKFRSRWTYTSEVYGDNFKEPMYMFTFEKLHSAEDVTCRIFIDGLLYSGFYQENNGFLEYVYIPVSALPDGIYVEVELFPSYNHESELKFDYIDQEYSILFETAADIFPTISDLVISDKDNIYNTYDHEDFELSVIDDDYNYYTNPEAIEDGPDFIKGYPYMKNDNINWAKDSDGNIYSYEFSNWSCDTTLYKIQPFLSIHEYSDLGFIELQINAIDKENNLVTIPIGDTVIKYLITDVNGNVIDKSDTLSNLSESQSGANGKEFLIPETSEIVVDDFILYLTQLQDFTAYIPANYSSWNTSVWIDHENSLNYIPVTDTGIIYTDSKQIKPISDILTKWKNAISSFTGARETILDIEDLISDLVDTEMSASKTQQKVVDMLESIEVLIGLTGNVNTEFSRDNLTVITYGQEIDNDLDYCKDCSHIRTGDISSYWRLGDKEVLQLDEIGTVKAFYYLHDMDDNIISDLTLTHEDIERKLANGDFIASHKTFSKVEVYDNFGNLVECTTFDKIPETATNITYTNLKPFSGNDITASTGETICGTGYYSSTGSHYLFDGQPDPDNDISSDLVASLIVARNLIKSDDLDTITLYPTDNEMLVSEDKLYVDYANVSDYGISILNLNNKGVNSTRLHRLKLKLKNEELLGKELTLHLDKDSYFNYQQMKYFNYPSLDVNIIRTDRVNATEDMANLGNEYIRVFKNGRLVSKNRYAFLTNLNNPRVQMLEMVKKNERIVVDGTPYRNRLVYFAGELIPDDYGEIYIDLREWINKPFDTRYYEVYLNGRRLGIKNVIPISQWEIRLVGVHSVYSLEIYEKDRDWEYYGCDFNNYFTISDLFEKAFMEKEIKDKLIKDIFGDLPYNDNTEEREPWERDLTIETVYFEIFYYNRLIPLILANGDTEQFNKEDIMEGFTIIYDHFFRPSLNGKDDVLLLSPDEYYGDDNEDHVYDEERWNVYMTGNNDEMAENDFESDIE